MNKLAVLLYVCVVSALLSACGASPKRVVAQDGPTVEEIMRGDGGQVADMQKHKQSVSKPLTSRFVGTSSTGHAEYTRDSINETRQLFPTLPNPTIALFIHPHMSVDATTGESWPVPGYTTAFPLYERVQYALPGELPSSRDPVVGPFPAGHSSETGAPYWSETWLRIQ